MNTNYFLKKIFGEESHNNKMYGHNIILQKYAKVKLPYIIPGQYQHGYHMGTGIHGYISKHTKKDKLKRYFVWNSKNLENCINLEYKNAIAIGAPILYTPINNTNTGNNSNLLFFPIHSSEDTHFINSIKVHEKYLENILNLNHIFKSVTVCLYWIEYENIKIRELFYKNNIKVVSLGHRDNTPNFLKHFINLVSKYSHVSSNSFSTAVFYSLYLRKKVFIYGKYDKRDFKLIGVRETKIDSNNHLYKSYPEILWKNFDDRSHYYIAEKELGLEFKKTPNELRELFGWNPGFLCKNLFQRLNRKLSKTFL